MGDYVEKNLRPGESVVAKAQISMIPLVPAAIEGLVVLIVGIAMKGAWGAIGVLACAIIIVLKVLQLKSIELGVTNKKIIGKTGVIIANSLDTYLEKIDNFSISETLGGKLFGYSTIQICTTSAKLRFNGVKDAMAFKNLVMDCIDARETEKFALQAQAMRDANANY